MGKYKPYTRADFDRHYPGKISEERKKQLSELDYSIEDLSANDMTWILTGSFAGIFHSLIRAVKDVAGEEMAKKVADRAGYSTVRGALTVGLKTQGTDMFNAEQWSWYQDQRHARSGIEGAQAYNTYDEEKCVVRREHCFFFTRDPEVRQYCKYFCEGALRLYREAQPGLDVRLTKNMPDGHACCEHVFIPPKRP